RIDGERPSVRFFSFEKYAPSAVGRHAIYFAVLAGGDKKIAFARKRHGPDIFLVRIEEDLRLAVRRNLVNLSVGIGSGVNLIFRMQYDGVDLEPLELSEGTALAARIDAEELGVAAACAASGRVQIASRIRSNGPKIWGG